MQSTHATFGFRCRLLKQSSPGPVLLNYLPILANSVLFFYPLPQIQNLRRKEEIEELLLLSKIPCSADWHLLLFEHKVENGTPPPDLSSVSHAVTLEVGTNYCSKTGKGVCTAHAKIRSNPFQETHPNTSNLCANIDGKLTRNRDKSSLNISAFFFF